MSSINYVVERRVSEALTSIRLIMPSVLERERELAQTKWFAYRFMSPLEATQHFADIYRAGFKDYVRQHHDFEQAELVHGLSTRIFGEPSRSLTELWHARQRADELAVPYNLLVEFGFEFAGRRKWNAPPRPGQLFGSKKSDVAWPTEFEKVLKEQMPVAAERLDLPQFRVENYRRHPVQDEFRQVLLDSMSHSNRSWNSLLELHCLKTRRIPAHFAIRLVPKDMRAGVISYLRSEAAGALDVDREHNELPDLAFAPSCFAIPFARSEAASSCRLCPFADRCSSTTEDVSNRMRKRFGCPSPLERDRKLNTKEKTRLRVRKLRERRKEATLTAGTCPSPEVDL